MAEDSLKKDLNWIKKYYGEKMMHMCRSFFPQILEVPGALPRILEKHFAKGHHLADDIQAAGRENDFKSIIFYYSVNDKHENFKSIKTAVELMDEAGYILYPECQTEEDIQAFKKYYAPGEKLCTFGGGRLNSCRVWFAVKKDVENIKRENFPDPQREDEYGTSVISIQFSRGNNSTLSIKNRYNHTVVNPDNTFYSDLDQIKPGLMDAFERNYAAYANNQGQGRPLFELKDYVCLGDKYYHYNYEINNVYYCDNNVVIDNFNMKQLDSNSQILMDYFVIDLKNKTIKLYDDKMNDSFVNSFGEITNITKQGNTLTISVKDGEDVVIGINDKNQMISLYNPNVKDCGDDYLTYNTYLEDINLPNLENMGNYCFYDSKKIEELNFPNLENMGNYCFYDSKEIEELNFPNLKNMGDHCFYDAFHIKEINAQNLQHMGGHCFHHSKEIEELNIPSLQDMGDHCFYSNDNLKVLNLPSILVMGYECFYNVDQVKEINAQNLKHIDSDCFYYCGQIEKLNLPSLQEMGNYCFCASEGLKVLNVPNILVMGNECFSDARQVKKINAQNLQHMGDDCFCYSEEIEELNLQNLQDMGIGCFRHCKEIEELNFPSLQEMGRCCFYDARQVKKINAQNLQHMGGHCFYHSKEIEELNVPKDVGLRYFYNVVIKKSNESEFKNE